MLKMIQRFGGAMFTPVLLFPFAGLVAGLSVVMTNPALVGSIAAPGTLWTQIWTVIMEGGWTVFRNMPLIFAVALPIGLARSAHARACLAVMIAYLTFNWFINAMLTIWGTSFGVDFGQEIGGVSGLTLIAGIKTLDTSIVGAIAVSALVTALHNRFFDKKLPDYLGIFQGTAFVTIVAFLAMLPCAFLTALLWPKVQAGIGSLQDFMVASGPIGVWVYTFLERILIPTGLHHFIYGPFIFGPAVVEGGIQAYWIQHIMEFSNATQPLSELFPQGAFALHGNSKIFGTVGIALAIYATAAPANKHKIAGLLIPATLTAVLVGITEPLEFTFLFIAPFLFAIHALLAATLAMVMYINGVVGNFGGGLIEFATQNWIPMLKNHSSVMLAQWTIGPIFTLLYFMLFRFLIVRFDVQTPGRATDDGEIKLFSKQDYKARGEAKQDPYSGQAAMLIEALGGEQNIAELNNCATRLRISVVDGSRVMPDSAFRELGAHGVVKNDTAIQVIIGLSVPQVRDSLETMLKQNVLKHA